MRKRKAEYIYSYDYEPNESWYISGDAQVEDAILEVELASDVDRFLSNPEVKKEIQITSERITQLRENRVAIALLSDTHYVRNGNWEYTNKTIHQVNQELIRQSGYGFDGIIHLGDFTDGLLGKDICKEYSSKVIASLLEYSVPFFIAVGNHDANYFRLNPEIMDENEQWDTYCKSMIEHNGAVGVDADTGKRLYYRSDWHDKRLIILSLSAYDNNETDRYGYSTEQIEWVTCELKNITQDKKYSEYKVIIISHDAPLTELDYWASQIRNGEVLCNELDAWNRDNSHRIIAFLHGHTHADYVYRGLSFPIISVGCSKIEYFEDKKPEGAIAPARYEYEVTQELWDTMLIDTDTGDIDLIRFGAGFDRHVEANGDYAPKIWAHRGASGYAPENTMEAFELASDMNADGIELDVQFTKDRQIVVIHDERIDRTSDGIGFVADYTLDELRQFNFNKTHPEYEHCDIPTLEEVLGLIKRTKLELNIELKTSINFYPGIERDTVDLVNKYGLQDRVIYSSFNHESIKRVKRYSRAAKCGLLYSEGIADIAQYAKQYEVEAIHPYMRCLFYPGVIDECRNNGIKINTWTVNEIADMKKMQQMNVDSIITNYPNIARNLYYGDDVDLCIPRFDNITQNKKNWILHMMGTMYKYVRRPFVAIDNIVQKAAGR